MPLINNPKYRNFLEGKFIEFIDEAKIKEVIISISGRHSEEAKALIILAYYSGARPEEYLSLKPTDFEIKNKWLYVKIPTLKGGVSRIVLLDTKKQLISILYSYIKTIFPTNYLFTHFRGHYVYKYTNPSGKIKEYVCHSYKLRYFFNKWFSGDINPYYLRHNRMSKLSAAGVPMQDLQQFKGSKTLASVSTYLHINTDNAKRIGKKND